MNEITNSLQNTFGIAPENQTKILYSLVILVVLGTIRFAILKIVWRLTEDPKSRYTWKRSVSFIIGFLTVILIGSVWIRAIGQFGAFLGLLTAGLAIALKDLLTNIAGWIFILTRKPFNLGDRVQIGEHAGDVIDIRLFQFTLLEIGNWVHADQSTGRIIHVPNGIVFSKAQSNYSTGFKYIWNEITVLVTFESNWQLAKKILQKIISDHSENLSTDAEKKIIEASKKYMIFYQYLTPIVYTSLEPSGILLTMRYICDPRKRRSTEHEIWEDVLKEFASHKEIEFAYPTQRFFTRPSEKDDSPL
ncbi:MAG: mechanosensitive ion channel family protein [Bacteroidales bacterium]|nr:mechanosensitive ion channel family protein [Bacteroidales bacterium]